MIEIIIFVLGIAVLLYVLLGGADFGAGIVELATGKKGINTISKAIAPVWEANHIWLILAVVILFNGFPRVFTTLTIYLHIPLFIVLVGIVFRGTAFTFRYYDIQQDNTQKHYTRIFRISSLLTPFFLGITLGAIILGNIPANVNGTFYEVFISPWLNLFTFTTGIFVTLLFGWLASIYLIGEAHDDKSYQTFAKTARIFFVSLILSGLSVFLVAEIYGLHLFMKFSQSLLAIGCVTLATVVIPLLWINVNRRNVLQTRLLAGIQTACIIAGWFAVQFPVMIFISGGSDLTVWNSQAPERTISLLVDALIVGILIILPAFAYLFKVFKFDNKGDEATN
ncbi:MAG TPA: cytochrome d ubiquinol oxidase subunit 2 [Prolixibacteraceae bacterium]|jgi:cytochrome d ubiquinol oxidase subunit II|nr:cytochrome d ubiquinol oxidase subunit 2 [Prolixibacteraceae bacterium]